MNEEGPAEGGSPPGGSPPGGSPPGGSLSGGSPPGDRSAARQRKSRLPHLSTATKLLLWFAGWLLVLLGVAGLVLPMLQGVITLLLGAAVLSLVSHSIFLGLRRLFRGWPRGWRRLLSLRRRVHGWLERKRRKP